MTVKPTTPIDAIYPWLDQLDLVLIMSVEPGFGGQKFMPASLHKVMDLVLERKRQGLSFLIEIDGGIDFSTAPQCIDAGVDVLVSGSTVFGAADIRTACQRLSAL